MEAAERGDGWINWCDDAGVYIAPSREFVAELAAVIRCCTEPVIEVAAGDGRLTAALSQNGCRVIASDPGSGARAVVRSTAAEALAEYRPATVLACFPPVDADIELSVFRCGSVQDFIYIGPIINDRPGPESLWNAHGWKSQHLSRLNEVMLSRLDYLGDFTRSTHRRRAAAMRFSRTPACEGQPLRTALRTS